MTSDKTRDRTSDLNEHGVHSASTSWPLQLESFRGLLGQELPQADVSRRLRLLVQSERAPVVGALHGTCSDEAEQECIDAFQRQFARYLLPSLKFFEKSSFRTANLGSRYEWGSVRIAESHFALAEGADRWKLMVVKLNSHVSVDDGPRGPVFGTSSRFGAASSFCGAMHALLGGEDLPFAEELKESFSVEGKDRLAILRDPKLVPPHLAGFFAAAVNARLQARRAMLDLQDHSPRNPTLYLVLPTLSLNRAHHDTEIVLGLYTADRRGPEPLDEYCGISDDPSHYSLDTSQSCLFLSDPNLKTPRPARDHRAMVLAEWNRTHTPTALDPRLDKVLEAADHQRKTGAFPHAKLALAGMLPLLVELSPVPAAAVLFGSGVVRIHNTQRAHKLYQESEGDAAARQMLNDVRSSIDAMSPDEARHTIALLLHAYRDKE